MIFSLRELKKLFHNKFPVRVHDIYSDQIVKPRGYVLVSYLAAPLKWSPNNRRFLGHSNCWESVEIVRILNSLGFSVDVISWDDTAFVPKRSYTAVFDIHNNLTRYGNKETVKIFHVTGSNPSFSNQAEQIRIADLQMRRGIAVMPRRSIPDEETEIFQRNLQAADVITILGNETTAATYPNDIRKKMHSIPVTGSQLAVLRDPNKIQFKNEFLWYGGKGAVHKGLDLVLDVFASNPDLTLHVVGPYLEETDFVRAYRYELTRCPNIVSHGYLYPSSKKFKIIAEHLTAFILPSCSEATSSAAVTCMQYGILPVVSVNCGLGLDDLTGLTLTCCSYYEIEQAVLTLIKASDKDIRQMTTRAQQYALSTFSRSAFTARMQNVLATYLL